MAGSLRNVSQLFLGALDLCPLNLLSSDPKFKQLERFLNNVKIPIPSSSGPRTNIIHGLIEHAGKFVFSKNNGQESTVGMRFNISPSDLMIFLLTALDLGL
jgi:hypothetical protein